MASAPPTAATTMPQPRPANPPSGVDPASRGPERRIEAAGVPVAGELRCRAATVAPDTGPAPESELPLWTGMGASPGPAPPVAPNPGDASTLASAPPRATVKAFCVPLARALCTL